MEKRLRIIQAVNVRWFNATAWYCLSLSRLLKQAGHEVLLLALPGTETFAKAAAMGLAPVPLDLNSANPFALSRLFCRLRGLLQSFRPHIVHCHRGEGMILWGLLKALGHDFALLRTRGDQRPPKANCVNRYLHSRLADALVVTNSRTARQCEELLAVPSTRLHTILGGVDRSVFVRSGEARARERALLGFAPEDFVVGLLGRFDAVKGQRELMEAFARARGVVDNENRRAKLLLMGFPAGLSQEQTERWAREYGIDDCTVLTGKVPPERLPGCINAMDLGVVASQGSEAIARAAFEILSCEAPLVGTDVGVMPDLLPPCALVPPGDPEALAALLAKGMGDASFRRELQECGRKRMEDLSEQSFLEQSMAVYRGALSRRLGKR